MKIVQTPPKTGEEFIVAWFDDGEATSWCFRYNKEHEMFERFWIGKGWDSVTSSTMSLIAGDSLIIVEG